MKRLVLLIGFLGLGWPTGASADIANPSTLEITEESPSRFRVVLTLPIINGRLAKAQPVLPEICIFEGEPTVKASAAKVVRTQVMTCEPGDLDGRAIGVSGLLGTSMEVQLTIATLDGRTHVVPLRPMESYFVVPQPPTLVQLAQDAGLLGFRRALRLPELALLILAVLLLARGVRSVAAALVVFALAHVLGQWLASQNWMAVSSFLPRLLTALTALLAALEIVAGRPLLRPGWHRPVWVGLLLLGLMYGATLSQATVTAGLSTADQRLASGLFALGLLAGLALWMLVGVQLKFALAGISPAARERWTGRLGYLAGVGACALCLYQASALAYIGVISPAIPTVALASAIVLGLWCRMQAGKWGGFLALLLAVLFIAGNLLRFRDVVLPEQTLVVHGLLALLGMALILGWRWLPWVVGAVGSLTALYLGHHAAQILRDSTPLPAAQAMGTVVLLAFLFFASYRATSAAPNDAIRKIWRVIGAVAVPLAILWRLAEYREWFTGQIASEYAMGLVRLPVLAAALLLVAWLIWPRRRRFQQQSAGAASLMHWVLLTAAFFTLPVGTLRVHNPLYTPRAPTVAEARRILDTLLTDTYLAFNLPDEEAAFDRLARNLSQELVADVYLDSRRRLTAGTREGAVVTVKDVSMMSVDAEAVNSTDGSSFTFPCQWIVTARVKHWQHIHSRQNAYRGDLTLRIEDDRWKISSLALKSEERTVLSWKKS